MDREETKLVYTYDSTGKYTGIKTLDYTDRSPISSAWQIPAGCTELIPFEPSEGMELVWDGEEWKQQPKPEEPEPPEPTEHTEDEKLQTEANNAKYSLRKLALSAVMFKLAGDDVDDIKEVYQAELMSISDAVALKIPEVFPTWNGNGVEYKKDTRLTYNGVMYKVLQDHTSQSTWTPDAAPSLFTKVLTSTDGQPSQWIQPDSTNPYMTGDKVIYNGHCYQSTIDNNVWAPDAYPDGWNMLY